MSSLEDIKSTRLKKLQLLEEFFTEVYPARTERGMSVKEVLQKFSQLLKSKKKITLAGRIRSLRPHGGSAFFDIEEDGARIQAFLRKEDLPEKLFDLFLSAIDIGDFVELSGRAYLTKRKERTLLVSGWKPLAKALLPLPEKWHGLQNIEERYRHRSLDLLSNSRTREIFTIRTKTISFLRNYFDSQGFLEVETPMLQPIAGGAAARPFITHHNALDIDLYLRIAPELYLKRLLVGGFSRVYEISRNFRNEGIDGTHNPEFTMLEAYYVFRDYTYLMHFSEMMLEKLVRAICGKKKITYLGKDIEIKSPFKRMTFYEAMKRYALLANIERMTQSDLVIVAKRFGIEVNPIVSRVALTEDIFRKIVRPHLIQPTFITDWPLELFPLAKRSSKDPNLVESFQLYVGGIELLKAFSELNDPQDQAHRFSHQDELRKQGDEEASRGDDDFIENMEYGMPPAAGFGLGIDRLALLLTNSHNIREVILFPTLRPK